MVLRVRHAGIRHALANGAKPCYLITKNTGTKHDLMTNESPKPGETGTLSRILSPIRHYFFDDEPDPAGETSARYSRMLLAILLCWMVFWTVLPCISLANDFVDVLENIVWGRHFQFGFDKNPYAGPFFGLGVWYLSGKAFFSSFLASQVCVFTGILCVHCVAKRILPPRTAFLAALTLLLVNFYGIKATELCDDVMELAVWPLTMMFVYLGVKGGRREWAYWLGAGFFAGLSLMVKYFAPAMYASVLIPLIFTKEGRSVFRRPRFYLAAIPFALVVLPNVLWLFSNDFKPLHYAFGRAALEGREAVALADHFIRPLQALDRAATVFGVAIIFFALFFPWRRKRAERPRYSSFDRVFVWSCCWGMLGSAMVFSLVTGGKINYSWMVPCFPFLGVWLFLAWSPRMTRMKARAYTVAVLLMGFTFGVIFVLRSLEKQGYQKNGCDNENYPGHAITRAATGLWHEVSPDPLPFVVADRLAACCVSVYSDEAPEAFFCADFTQSQWIDPEEFSRRGGVMVWDERDEWHGVPEMMNDNLRFIPPERFGEVRMMRFERAVPGWYRKLRGAPKPVNVRMRVIYPEPAGSSDSAAPSPAG